MSDNNGILTAAFTGTIHTFSVTSGGANSAQIVFNLKVSDNGDTIPFQITAPSVGQGRQYFEVESHAFAAFAATLGTAYSQNATIKVTAWLHTDPPMTAHVTMIEIEPKGAGIVRARG